MMNGPASRQGQAQESYDLPLMVAGALIGTGCQSCRCCLEFGFEDLLDYLPTYTMHKFRNLDMIDLLSDRKCKRQAS